MHLCLPLLLCALVTIPRFKADAEQVTDPRYQLGKALLRRVREINETAQSNEEVLEDSDSEMSEEERERVQQIDSAEDIFVGSGNHVYESQGKSENSDSKGEETSGDEDVEANEAEEVENTPTSGDGGDDADAGDDDDDDDEEEKSDDDDDDDDDGTEKKNDKEESTEEASSEEDDSSGSGLIESENAARRSMDVSGSGSGSGEQNDDSDQSDQSASGSGESTIQESAPSSTSKDEAGGAAKETKQDEASKKSEIEESVSGDSEEEEDSGSAEVIRKGIESLSRLLTPVASGYDFELYSGKSPKNGKEESEAEGENEKGDNNDAQDTHVKQCKRVCEDPMTYEQCAVPRCDYKMGTIKDLCIYLCKHQIPVCRQECE